MAYESPVWEDSYKQGSWTSMFPGVLHTQQGSTSHIKKLIAVGFSCITFLRNVFPQVAYEMRVVDDLHVALLLEDCGIPCPNMFVDLLYSAFEAIERKYLRELSLVFLDEYCEVVQEIYTFKIKYKENGEASLTEFHCCDKKDLDERMNVKGHTLNLLRAIIVMTQSMKPLPDNVAIRIYIDYYERATPTRYQPRGFKAVSPLPSEIGESISLKIGTVKMIKHNVQLHATIKYSVLEDDTVIVQQPDKQPSGPEKGEGEAGCEEESSFISPKRRPVARQFSVRYPLKAVKTDNKIASNPKNGEKSWDSEKSEMQCGQALSDCTDAIRMGTVPLSAESTATHGTVQNLVAEESSEQGVIPKDTALQWGLDLQSTSFETLSTRSEKGTKVLHSSFSSTSRSSESSFNGIIRCPCGLKGRDDVMIICKHCCHHQHGACFRILSYSDIPSRHVCELCAQAGRPCTDSSLGSSCPRKVRETCILRRVYAHLNKAQGPHTIESLAEHFGLDKEVTRMVSVILYADGAFFTEDQNLCGRLVNKPRLLSCLIPRYFHPTELPVLYDGEKVQASELLKIRQMFQREQLSQDTARKIDVLPSKCHRAERNSNKDDGIVEESIYSQELDDGDRTDQGEEFEVTDDESLGLLDFEVSEMSLLNESLMESLETMSELTGLDQSLCSSSRVEDADADLEYKSLDSCVNTFAIKARRRNVKDILEEDGKDVEEVSRLTEVPSMITASSHLSDDAGKLAQLLLKDTAACNSPIDVASVALPGNVSGGHKWISPTMGRVSNGNTTEGQQLLCARDTLALGLSGSQNEAEAMKPCTPKASHLSGAISCHDCEKNDGEMFGECCNDDTFRICVSEASDGNYASDVVSEVCHGGDLKFEMRSNPSQCRSGNTSASKKINSSLLERDRKPSLCKMKTRRDCNKKKPHTNSGVKKGSGNTSSSKVSCLGPISFPTAKLTEVLSKKSVDEKSDLLKKYDESSSIPMDMEEEPQKKEKKAKFFKGKTNGVGAHMRVNTPSWGGVSKPKFFKTKFVKEQEKDDYWSSISSYGEEENSDADWNSSKSFHHGTTSLPIFRGRSSGKDPYEMKGNFDKAVLPVPPKRKKCSDLGSPYEDFNEREEGLEIPWKYFKKSKRKKQMRRNLTASV